MLRVERILEFLQVIVAGLAFGVVTGLTVHVVVSDPAVLTGASLAYAGDVAESEFDPAPTAAATDTDVDLSLDPTRRLPTYARERYYYAPLGRRDPFRSLVAGELETDGAVGLPDVGDLKLVGIAWDAADRFAMAEDSRGFGYVLREGDKVRGGRVAGIARDAVTFSQYTAGERSTITLELPIREDAQ